MPPKKKTPAKKATASNNNTPKPKRGNRLNNNYGSTPSTTKKTIEHHVVVVCCVFNVLVMRCLRKKPDGTYQDAYHYDFTNNIDCDEFDTDGVKMLRNSADSNAGKPKTSDPSGYYKEMVLLQLPLDNGNPILTPGVSVDQIEEAARWGEIVAKELVIYRS